jgi:hypothetical protein
VVVVVMMPMMPMILMMAAVYLSSLAKEDRFYPQLPVYFYRK